MLFFLLPKGNGAFVGNTNTNWFCDLWEERNVGIVLASSSPRRRELLERLQIRCEVCPSGIDETIAGRPADAAVQNAISKAVDVHRHHSQKLVIGADTVVVYGSRVLGKPNSAGEAAEMLSILSGNQHKVITGVACVDSRTKSTFFEETSVWFRRLTDEDIQGYIGTGEPMDKAGAYGIQGIGGIFVERVSGCYYNVVGLPVPRLLAELERHFGFSFWKQRLQGSIWEAE